MMKQEMSIGRVTRRDLIRLGIAGGGALALGETAAWSAEGEKGKTDVWVFHGTDKPKLMRAVLKTIGDNGGFGSRAKKLTLKVNAAWWRTPEQASNTNPELVDAFLKGVRDMGIKEIVMPEHPVDAAKNSFPRSGLLGAAKANSATMIDLGSEKKLFREVELPGAKRLTKARIARDVLETDALVNMPVAKHHGSAGLTMAMKNWLGSVEDRRFLHRNNLLQCIADLSTLIKPSWTVIDALRIMLSKGPKGPSEDMKTCNVLVVSKDQIAADAYAATLFPEKLRKQAKYIQIAGEMKLGTVDIARMAVHKVEVS